MGVSCILNDSSSGRAIACNNDSFLLKDSHSIFLYVLKTRNIFFELCLFYFFFNPLHHHIKRYKWCETSQSIRENLVKWQTRKTFTSLWWPIYIKAIEVFHLNKFHQNTFISWEFEYHESLYFQIFLSLNFALLAIWAIAIYNEIHEYT